MAELEETWRLPKVVQELAAGVKELPSRYVLPEQDRHGVLLVGNEMPDPIPVIDLSRLPVEADESDKLKAALQGWGLFLVINHGIEDCLMDDVMNASKDFFGQPLEEKQKCSNLIDGKHFQVEGFALQEYTSKTKRIKHVILTAMARLLKLDGGYFLDQFSDKAPTTVRINHYVPCSRPDVVLGFKAHSDDGVLAILLVDNHVMSNGIFMSPVHRVVANSEKERTSLAMFYGLDPEKEFGPAADLLHDNQPARYRKLKTRDYMAGFYEHFARGTRVLDSMKV
ncbi:hypothetical protein ACQ4PT_025753 [Festuca glaucescens]